MTDIIGNVKIVLDTSNRGVTQAASKLGISGVFPFTRDKKVRIKENPVENLPTIVAEFSSKEYANIGLLAGVTLKGIEYPHVHIKEDFAFHDNGNSIIFKEGTLLVLEL